MATAIDDLTHINNHVDDAVAEIKKRADNKGCIASISTGIEALDDLTGGFHPSQLVVIGSRPSMGATALCLNFAQYMSAGNQLPVAIFSSRTSKRLLASRLLQSMAELNATRLRAGMVDDNDWSRIYDAANRFKSLPILIDDSFALTADQIFDKCKRARSEMGDLGLVIINGIQHLNTEHLSDTGRQDLPTISGSLKNIAHQLNVPLIVVSPINELVDGREDNRPQLRDLHKAIAVEDVDLVMFLYRQSYYDLEAPDKNCTEIIIAKNRHGPLGTFELYFDFGTGSFRNQP
ncbi:MAG: hypothetical protein K2W82_09835 [Candidatus Obscuribacterales bacterium]|nr:hypothetical protein [Candidatus Obscuribacterales bacterium]